MRAGWMDGSCGHGHATVRKVVSRCVDHLGFARPVPHQQRGERDRSIRSVVVVESRRCCSRFSSVCPRPLWCRAGVRVWL